MFFKDNIMDYYEIDDKLKQILSVIDKLSILMSGTQIVVTSLIRPIGATKSYHPLGLAADVRTHGRTPEEIMKLENFLFYIRDNIDSRLGVEPHENLKGTRNQHLHIQYRKDGVEPR